MDQIYLKKLYLPFLKENELVDELNQLFDSTSLIHKKFVVGKLFIEELLSYLKRDSNFMTKLYHTRYQPVFNTRDHSSSPPFCLSSEFNQLYLTKKKEILPLLQSSIQFVTETFQKIQSSGRSEIHLGNYIEDLLEFLVGVEDVSLVLKNCF